MGSRTLTPTIHNALGSWVDGFNTLGWNRDGYGAYNTGGGLLALTGMHSRFDLNVRDGLLGFQVELRARLRSGGNSASDSFTDVAGTRLDQHNGELNADWQRPFTGNDPSYQRINSAGRTYYAFENGSGFTQNGSEHFLSNFVPSAADYTVEARIYAASDGGSGEYAEIYARASTPYTFYILQYDEGANTWRLGYWDSGSRSPGQLNSLGTYAGDAIPVGGSRLAKLEVIGTSIKAYIDGVERIAATSSHITAAGFPGLRIDPGASRPVGAVVTALIDLGSAQTVTRCKKRIGWVENVQTEFVLEASNDGSTWVNAYTGFPLIDVPDTGSFQWIDCQDTTSITATPYRYWRTTVVDPSTTPEPRIGDFRLWVGGVPATPSESRYGHRAGDAPHNWADGTVTTLFGDVGDCDNTTSVGGTLASPYALEGLQFEDFAVGGIASGSLNVCLSANGSSVRGNTKNVALSGAFADYVLGSPTDLWGASWTVEEVRAATFGLLLERGSGSSEVEVDAIRVVATYLAYGGPLYMIREQVRQQVLIGRETGTNAVQTLTITGTPTGGTFKLTFNGVETGTIAYNAAAATVQAALEAISSIGAGNVACTGGALPGTPVVITFQGSLAASPVNLITVTSKAFTGGTAPDASVANTTPGVRAVGNGATPNIRLRHARIMVQPNPEMIEHRPAGEKLINHTPIIKEDSDGSIEDAIPTYDELGLLLAGIIARPNTGTLHAAVAYRHVFALDNRVRDAIATYECQYGDQFSRSHKVKGLVINALEMAFRTDGIDLSGSIFAKSIEDGITMNPGAATVQTLTFSGTGTIRLGWKGQETADLNVATMTNTDVQTALRALAGIGGSTELTVAGGSSPFTITFGNGAAGPFKGMPQPLLTIRVISGTPTTAIAMTTRGGYTDFPGVVIVPKHCEAFLSPTLADLGASKMTNVFATGLQMGNKATPVYNLDRTVTSWFDYVENPEPDVNFNMIVEAQSPAMQFLPQGRSDTILFLRLLLTSPLMIGASSYPYRMQIDAPVKITNFGPFGEDQNVVAFTYEFAVVQDDATNSNLVITLDNGTSSY